MIDKEQFIKDFSSIDARISVLLQSVYKIDVIRCGSIEIVNAESLLISGEDGDGYYANIEIPWKYFLCSDEEFQATIAEFVEERKLAREAHWEYERYKREQEAQQHELAEYEEAKREYFRLKEKFETKE